MENLSTAIEFVSKNSGGDQSGQAAQEIANNAANTNTGDLPLLIISLIIFLFSVCALYAAYSKNKRACTERARTGHYKIYGKHANLNVHSSKPSNGSFLSLIKNPLVLTVFVIAIISAVLCLNFSVGYAQNAKQLIDNNTSPTTAAIQSTDGSSYNISAPDKIKAVVDEQAKTVTFENAFIKNAEDAQKFKLSSIGLKKVADKGSDNWTIKSGDTVLYNNVSDQSADASLNIDPNTQTDFVFDTSASFDTCKSYVGKTAVVANYELKRYSIITGQVVDGIGSAIRDARVEFAGQSTITDDSGAFRLYALAGSTGDVLISSDNFANTSIKDIKVTNKDMDLEQITMKNLAKEPVVLDAPTYNKAEQVGVTADDSVDLKGYSAVNAGDYTAKATPVDGYAWKDGSVETKDIAWHINKAEASITAPNVDVACGGITAKKHATYNGDQNDHANVSFVFDDQSVELNTIEGNPQDMIFSIKSSAATAKSDVTGTISIAESTNYNQAQQKFNVNIIASAAVTGTVKHAVTNNEYTVNLKYADRDGDVLSLNTTTSSSFQFSGIPLYAEEPYIQGLVSCNYQGMYAKNDCVIDNSTVVADLSFGSKELDNYSLEDLTKISEDISKNGESSAYYTEFKDYMKNDTYWFSQSNSQQSEEVKNGDFSAADPALCNQNYKNSFLLSGEIEKKDYDLCQFMFLRIIGVNEDKYANIDGTDVGKNAGLTFQAVRSLPRGYSFQDDAGAKVSWWGDANNALRRDLSQDGGLVYTNLADAYKSNIITVQNKSQADSKQESGTDIKTTGDKLFCLSYTEMCSQGTENFDADYYKDSAEGGQYSWYKEQNILGNKKNEILKDLGQANSGDEMGTKQSIAYQRTPYFGSYGDQQFLTCNMDGKIFTYSKSFNERCGIAPAFCLGSYTNLNHITMDGQNVEMLDTNSNVIASDRYTVQNSFSFKLRPAAGLSVKEVKVNGEVVTPKDEVYTINVSAQTNIEVTTTGESEDSPHIVGTAYLEKNIGDKVQSIPQAGQIVKVYIDGQCKANATTDSNGKYNIDLLDSALVGKSAVVSTDARPGVNGSQATISSLTKGDNLQDVKMHGLDFYTIPELKAAGDWLSANGSDSDIKNTACYKEFYSYMENTCVWYGNSNGKQSNDLSDSNPNAFNPSLANPDYRCFFADAGENSQYLFLRIIGLLHDELSSGNGYAGLTFQTAHSIPVKTVFGGTWWGDSTLRERMQRNGDIFNKLSACNLTDYISSVNKYSQADRSITPNILPTQDKLFLISYSEAWSTDGVMEKDRSWYGNSGINTEGYTYEWYKLKNTSGSNGEANPHIKYLHWNNNGADVGEKSSTWQRSVYFDNQAYNMLIRVGALNSWNFDTSGEGLAICFCLGEN